MNNTDILFIILFSILFYSYLGYGIVLLILVKIKILFFKNQTQNKNHYLPKVTLLVAAWNEESVIEEKIKNSFELIYPKDKLNFLFVTDGSFDNTQNIIGQYPEITLLHQEKRNGKTAAINRAMLKVNSDIVIFSDANTMLNNLAIMELVKHYDNHKIGCVSGEKRINMTPNVEAAASGEGLYWKYESKLKQWDAQLYSVAGAAGELFSIRTKLFRPLKEDTILDDFMISLNTVENGYRIAYEPNAYALENSSDGIKEEMKRKIRICAGGFQAIFRLPALLNIFRFHIFTFQYLSHRLLRWSLAPVSLFLLLPLNIYTIFSGIFFYKITLIFQLLFYTMVFLGYKNELVKTRNKFFFIPLYFAMMNYAVILGFCRFISKNQSPIWQRAKRKIN